MWAPALLAPLLSLQAMHHKESLPGLAGTAPKYLYLAWHAPGPETLTSYGRHRSLGQQHARSRCLVAKRLALNAIG